MSANPYNIKPEDRSRELAELAMRLEARFERVIYPDPLDGPVGGFGLPAIPLNELAPEPQNAIELQWFIFQPRSELKLEGKSEIAQKADLYEAQTSLINQASEALGNCSLDKILYWREKPVFYFWIDYETRIGHLALIGQFYAA